MRITDPNFFTVSAVELAQKLLGKILVRKINEQVIKVRIVETEAYIGKIDRACHAHQENKSKWKSSALYNRGGCAYIYLIYNTYYCFNIASSNKGDPQGVLIRAAEPLESHTIPVISQFQVNKDMKKIYYHTNGPGKLCRALNIDINLNHADLTTSDLIYLENAPEIIPDQIVATKRVNIDYAGDDKDRLWRFYIKENSFVSRK
ncbi:MAG: DNA-3-methyladenine glycosylase [Mycoplasmataceae bacterium RV_VA103A]|nr:MAG: DNA-3-methyladenine glycosylase [Mycoplasmataceae bacterium RV_VA103A]